MVGEGKNNGKSDIDSDAQKQDNCKNIINKMLFRASSLNIMLIIYISEELC